MQVVSEEQMETQRSSSLSSLDSLSENLPSASIIEGKSEPHVAKRDQPLKPSLSLST